MSSPATFAPWPARSIRRSTACARRGRRWSRIPGSRSSADGPQRSPDRGTPAGAPESRDDGSGAGGDLLFRAVEDLLGLRRCLVDGLADRGADLVPCVAQQLPLLRRGRQDRPGHGASTERDGSHRQRARLHEPVKLRPDVADGVTDVLPDLPGRLTDVLADASGRLADLADGTADGVTHRRRRIANPIAEAVVVCRACPAVSGAGRARLTLAPVHPQQGEASAGHRRRNWIAPDRVHDHVRNPLRSLLDATDRRVADVFLCLVDEVARLQPVAQLVERPAHLEPSFLDLGPDLEGLRGLLVGQRVDALSVMFERHFIVSLTNSTFSLTVSAVCLGAI